uniref:SEC14 domain and spectrin repeat-containing protein 1 n=1 Tax=Cacopsylla melanoneura TaxID=428564 RepID=A0A8D8YY29_9HEMI
MEASSILTILESRIATIPGGTDRDGRPLLFVTAFPEAQSTATLDKFDTLLEYLASLFSPETRRLGLCVVLDATRGPWRIARNVVRQVSTSLGTDIGCLLVLRHDAFWDNCTRAQRDGEPIFIPVSRLVRYIDASQLPTDYSGLWSYDHSRWIANRIDVEEFVKGAEHAVSELERLRTRLVGGATFRLSTAEESLSGTSDMFASTKQLGQKVLNIGETITQRLTHLSGQDQKDTKERLERLIQVVKGKLSSVENSWLELHRNIIDAKEVEALEDGVRRVTDWILGAGESMLIGQQDVGYDISSAEDLRQAHNAVELQCRETYGHYAELVHKIDLLTQSGVTLSEDLTSQRDFMDFVCRSFATRLERRRNILITSARFFRLVSEYFQTTSEVYEQLVMSCDLDTLESAHANLQQLQTSQEAIAEIETTLVREGEKLSDLLSMPVKDSFGRDVGVNYENDIVNIKEILEMTSARKSLFQDSVELQRLTLTQVTHIYNYEKDSAQALEWLEDLYRVMCKHHAHVGCTDREIQVQKEQHQVLQETAKSTFEYGCQLLKAALSLRQSCKFLEDHTQTLQSCLDKCWDQLNSVGQEQLTRLRVSAVFYRNVKEQCDQLHELMDLAKTESLGTSRGKVRKLLANRERLLVEIGRMMRLGRLLKTRLREPLSSETKIDDMNETAVESISEKLAEVALLAEALDKILETNDVIKTQEKGSEISEWYDDADNVLPSTSVTDPQRSPESINTSSNSTSSDSQPTPSINSQHNCTIAIPTFHEAPPSFDQAPSTFSLAPSTFSHSSPTFAPTAPPAFLPPLLSKTEEFPVSPERTSTPRSRSSSFHTASEGEGTSPWWEMDPSSDPDVEHVTSSVRSSELNEKSLHSSSQPGISDEVTSTTGEVNNNIIDPVAERKLSDSISIENDIEEISSTKISNNNSTCLLSSTLNELSTDFSERASCDFRSLPSNHSADSGNQSSAGSALFESTSVSTNSSSNFCLESSQSTTSSGFHETSTISLGNSSGCLESTSVPGSSGFQQLTKQALTGVF